MKKAFLLVFVAFGLQISTAQEFSFGAKGGLNIANVAGDDVTDADARTGLNLGLVGYFSINEKFGVQPELLYSQMGTKNNEEGETILKLDYVSIPVLANFEVSEGFSLQAGPQLGFKINSEVEFEGVSVDLDDEVNGFDFGAALGAQYKLDSGLFFQARYTLGLSDIVEDSDASNTLLSFSVGYFFK